MNDAEDAAPEPAADPTNEYSGQTVTMVAGSSTELIAKTKSGPNG